jgi:hypothetical protein
MTAISTLRTQYLSLPEESAEGIAALLVAQGRRGLAGHHDHREPFYHVLAAGPVRLADVPLDAISDDGPANLARYGHSKFAPLPFSPDHVTNECAPYGLFPVLVNVFELTFTGKALSSWKLFLARHCRLTTSVSIYGDAARSRRDRAVHTERRLRPFRRRRLSTNRPPTEAILARKPWVRFRFSTDG